MNKKILAGLLLIVVMFTGCQLAVPEAASSKGKDKLVGVFVTEEYLDLYDFEAFAAENSNKLVEGESLVFDSEYEGKVFATGSKENPSDIRFEDYDGVLFIDASYEKDGERYSSVGCSSQISQIHISVDDKGRSIEGTVFVKDKPIIEVMMNPVYETESGEIYLMSGSGMSMDNEYGSSSMSMFLSESRTVREGSEETEESFKVKVNFEGALDVDHYVLKQMNENDDQLIGQLIYQDDIPESIEVMDDAAYMILEKRGVDHEGESFVERTMINEEESFNVFFFGESDFAESHYIQLKRDGEAE